MTDEDDGGDKIDGGELGLEALSASTLAALNGFLQEKEAAERAGVSENFGLSQFWYTDTTAETLARAVMDMADRSGRERGVQADEDASIAILCSPTCLKGMRSTGEGRRRRNVKILEFDRRFEAEYPGDFVYYDVHDPDGLVAAHPELPGTFDAILSDPPYTDADTVRHTMEGMRRLARFPIVAAGPEAVPGRDFTPCIFISALLSRDVFLGEFGFRPCRHRLAFASKFATPMYAYTNVNPGQASHLGSWLADDDIGDQQNVAEKDDG